MAIDTACSSSLSAMDQAVAAMRAGLCDAAIVAGCTLNPRPGSAMQLTRLGLLSDNGACRSFDAECTYNE